MVIDALKKISFSYWFECREYLSEDTREMKIISSNKALEVIEMLPSAQPEPKKSVWIRMSDRDVEYYCCNNCGEELPRYMSEIPSWDMPYPHKYSIDPTDFCPHCVADNRENKN